MEIKRQTSQRGIELIKKWEGCRLNAYTCPSGVLTIGYGHTKDVKKGMTISEAKAELFLKEDLMECEEAVNNLTYFLNQNQFDALVSFTFNCGIGNLHNLTKNDTRTIPEIAEKMLLYNKSNGVVLTGLVNRRKEEHDLFIEDNYKEERLRELNNLILDLTSLKNQMVKDIDLLIERYGRL